MGWMSGFHAAQDGKSVRAAYTVAVGAWISMEVDTVSRQLEVGAGAAMVMTEG